MGARQLSPSVGLGLTVGAGFLLWFPLECLSLEGKVQIILILFYLTGGDSQEGSGLCAEVQSAVLWVGALVAATSQKSRALSFCLQEKQPPKP